MTPRFDAIGLVATDMAASLAFYRKLGLDIPAEADAQPHAEAALPGGLRLMWDSAEALGSADPGWTPPKGGGTIGLAFVCDSPADVDTSYSELVAAVYTAH
ncbi:VOC family protein, partial [Streptomyces sp. H27-D2]|uniref:VOC family protein n=1 Tax=Streptomyces sp. H27-D2 TaxID=3046304 RepID=UPI002DBE0E96